MFLTLLAATMAAVVAARAYDNSRDEERQAERADRAEVALRTVIGGTVSRLEDLAGALEQSPTLGEAGFHALNERLLREPALGGTAFIARLPGSERAAFERRQRARIVDVRPDGRLVPARPSRAYFVATQIASREPRRPAGQVINVGSTPDRRAAMTEAMRTGRAARTGPVAVAANGRNGVVVYAPVIGHGGRLRGFVSGVYYTNRLEAEMQDLLGSSEFTLSDAAAPPADAAASLEEPVLRNVRVAGRNFALRVGGEPDDGMPSAVWLALLGGLLTVLLTGLAVLAERRERYALRLVDRRLEERDAAQAIARVGSWDWDLETGAGTWSPELWNIYGREPRAAAPALRETSSGSTGTTARPWSRASGRCATSRGRTRPTSGSCAPTAALRRCSGSRAWSTIGTDDRCGCGARSRT